jgi:hypothetical protein
MIADQPPVVILTLLSLRALLMTDTELKLMAAAASTGVPLRGRLLSRGSTHFSARYGLRTLLRLRPASGRRSLAPRHPPAVSLLAL